MRLPDFVVAGSRKCGTTWLHNYLSSHPQIGLPSATKEIFFFDRYWSRGLGWYEKYFESCPATSVCGDISPSYFADPCAADRIRETLPNAKIVFIFRNPVTRAKSAYQHLVSKGDTRLPFDKALDVFPELIEESLYYRHLSRFEALFGTNAIHTIILEEAAARESDPLGDLFRFLGVDAARAQKAANEKIYEARTPRSSLTAKWITKTSRAMHHIGLHSVVSRVRDMGADRLLFKADSEDVELSPEVLSRLNDIFYDDVRRLSGHFGRDLAVTWNLKR